jgi:NADP-dependent aldehyde dehydrogenase
MIQLINSTMEQSWKAFQEYRNISAAGRLEFLKAIAKGLEAAGDDLVQVASEETNLAIARLRNELARTIHQLISYGEAAVKGVILDIRIVTAISERNPPRPDIRKMNLPIGPVVVFGASNFPFAYSTPGGDTASALAAGCTVVVKGHPAHARTSQACADIILEAARVSNMPKGVFAHIPGESYEIGQALVQHPLTRAVGFTGSLPGGRALFDIAATRKNPIPVFAEMGSVNPVYLLPEKLSASIESLVSQFTTSITGSVGQFCTKPGLFIGIEGDDLNEFLEKLSSRVAQIAPAKMLHPGIAKSYLERRGRALEQDGIDTLYPDVNEEGSPLVATVHAAEYLDNPVLHEEVFGPYALVIRCEDINQLTEIAIRMEGQITSTIIATDDELEKNAALVRIIMESCGRLIINGVPTGVEVVSSMHHGGPYPATTDSRFTSVGPDALRRFLRPLSFQNFPAHLLPDELKDENPLKLFRLVNEQLTDMPILK